MLAFLLKTYLRERTTLSAPSSLALSSLIFILIIIIIIIIEQLSKWSIVLYHTNENLSQLIIHWKELPLLTFAESKCSLSCCNRLFFSKISSLDSISFRKCCKSEYITLIISHIVEDSLVVKSKGVEKPKLLRVWLSNWMEDSIFSSVQNTIAGLYLQL